LFHYPIEKIILQFDNQKLVRLIIVTRFLREGSGSIWSTKIFQPINQLLAEQFGSNYTYDQSSYATATWHGQSVLLKSIYYHIATAIGSKQVVIVEGYDGGF
jgi:hypothetical protein